MSRILFFLLISLSGNICISQADTIAKSNVLSIERQIQLDSFVDMLRKDQIQLLADNIIYPLKRPNPIPDIKTKDDFILYYPILFDSLFKLKLVETTFTLKNTMERNGMLGLFNGAIWLNHEGRIMTINKNSKQEKTLLSNLHIETFDKMHYSISDWRENVLVCQTEKFLIRIDLMENYELRYISWNKPKTLESEPDLVLFDGVQEFQGTMGGVDYSFKNGDWTYQISRVRMAETELDNGVFLRLLKNDKEITSVKTEEIK